MAELKTKKTNASVEEFLNSIEDETKKADSFTLLSLFKKVTKQEARMWGTSIIGFGEYHYKSERSSQEGDWPLVGFSPRKQNLTLYVMPNLGVINDLLPKLGKNKISGGCLYINKLQDVDLKVLEEIIEKSFIAMGKLHK
jgi:hypothetical protein